ncbi:hypothetical protein MIPYR_20215 [uncultured Microbacterium sp.]|uniref:Uncharacterized protein n=1 Tax=uncultured Microbacterium sp. TaxID=191216 RepID=A0A1Y5P2M4_9MICO|nr:hypothetical protein MIPYR_20215 [uncultured Microbacterium sp.]
MAWMKKESADLAPPSNAQKHCLTGAFVAETEGFEPSVPVRELHLSRVKSRRSGHSALSAVAPLSDAKCRVDQALSVRIAAALGARYALLDRPVGGRSACSGTPGGHLARRVPPPREPPHQGDKWIVCSVRSPGCQAP